MGKFKYFHSFIANNNNLSGPIPESIGYSKSLTNFDVGSNNITGPIPASIGNCQSLSTLYLYNNNMSGKAATAWSCPSVFLVDAVFRFIAGVDWQLHFVGTRRYFFEQSFR
jgi:hypothetical protein